MLRLREIRKSKNMTQAELAKLVNVAQGVLSSFENGECFPSFKTLIRLARALDCSLDELVDMEGDPIAS